MRIDRFHYKQGQVSLQQMDTQREAAGTPCFYLHAQGQSYNTCTAAREKWLQTTAESFRVFVKHMYKYMREMAPNDCNFVRVFVKHMYKYMREMAPNDCNFVRVFVKHMYKYMREMAPNDCNSVRVFVYS